LGDDTLFSQILLGLAFIFFAYEHHQGREWIINNKLKNAWSLEKRHAYQKALVLPYTLLGILFILMGFVESLNVFSVTEYVVLYSVLAIPILGYSFLKARTFFKD
jgi:hypothetical protein